MINYIKLSLSTVLLLVLTCAGVLLSALDESYTSTQSTIEYDASNRVTKIIRPGFTDQRMEYEKVTYAGKKLWRTQRFEGDTLLAETYADDRGRVLIERVRMSLVLNDAGHALLQNGGQANLTKSQHIHSAPQWSETVYKYDENKNRLTSVKHPDGGLTKYGYNYLNQISSITHPNGGVEKMAYDHRGQLRSSTDAEGHTTKYTYLENGLLHTVTDPGGHISRMEYDAAGNLVKTIEQGMKSDTAAFDALNRLVKIIDVHGRTHEIQYQDVNGSRITKTTIPALAAIGANQIKETWRPESATLSTELVGTSYIAHTKHRFDGSIKEHQPFAGRGIVKTYKNALGRYIGNDVHMKLKVDETNSENFVFQAETTYYDDGRIKQMRNPGEETTEVQYDEQTFERNKVLSNHSKIDASVDPDNPIFEVIARDINGNTVWYRTQRGEEIVKGYNKIGLLKVMQRVRPLGTATRYEYTPSGLMKKRTDENPTQADIVTHMEYDEMGRITLKKSKHIHTKTLYYANGSVAEENRHGKIYSYIYDNKYQLKFEQSPLHTVDYHYDTYGRLFRQKMTSKKDGQAYDIVKTTYDYTDEGGEIIRTTGGGTDTRITKDVLGQVIKVEEMKLLSDDALITKMFEYDLGGNLIKTEIYKEDDVNPTRVIKQIKSLSEISSGQQADGGGSGNQKSTAPQDMISGGFTTEVVEEDENGNVLTSVTAVYDQGGNFRSSKLSSQNEIYRRFDAFGRLNYVEIEDGPIYEYLYKEGTLLVERVFARYPDDLSTGSDTFNAFLTYNSNDNLTQVLFDNGLQRNFSYNSDGLLTRVEQVYPAAALGTFTNQTGIESFDCVYDNRDRLTKLTQSFSDLNGNNVNQVAQTHYAYDDWNNLIYEFEDSAAGYLNQFGHDSFSNRTELRTIPSHYVDVSEDALTQFPIAYSYAASEAPTFVRIDLTHNSDFLDLTDFNTTITLTGDLAGQTKVRTVTLHTKAFEYGPTLTVSSELDGTADAIGGQYVSGRMQVEIISLPNGGVVLVVHTGDDSDALRFNLDGAIGRITNIAVATGGNQGGSTPETVAHSFEHHVINEISQVTASEMDYDVNHRLTEKSHYPSTGGLIKHAYTYNDLGHLIEVRDTSLGIPGTVIATYDYDVLGRLINADTPGSSAVAYDYHAGSWMKKSTAVGGTTYSYTWDGASMLQMINDLGTSVESDDLITNYAQAGTNNLWKTVGSEGNPDLLSAYMKNHRGDITGLYGAFHPSYADKGVQERFHYDGFGNTIVHEKGVLTPGISATFVTATDKTPGPRYRGYWNEGENGLYQLQNRHYDSQAGRFLQVDPARAGNNFYAYASGDPVNRWDPNGLDDIEVRGGKVYWVPEHDGNLYNPNHYDLEEVVGTSKGTYVTLNNGSHGIHLHELEAVADPMFTANDDRDTRLRRISAALMSVDSGNYASTHPMTEMAFGALNELETFARHAGKTMKEMNGFIPGGDFYNSIFLNTEYYDFNSQTENLSKSALRSLGGNPNSWSFKDGGTAFNVATIVSPAAGAKMLISMSKARVSSIGSALKKGGKLLTRAAAGTGRFAKEVGSGLKNAGLATGRFAKRFGNGYMQYARKDTSIYAGSLVGAAQRNLNAIASGLRAAVKGPSPTRTGTRHVLGEGGHRLAPIDIEAGSWQAYERGVRGLYGEASFAQRQYRALVDGQWVNGVADNVASIGGKNVAIEAKFLSGRWAGSIRNPHSSIGGKAFSKAERWKMVNQAKKYSAAFDEVIYHTNSTELMGHYSRLFQKFGLNNVRFVFTP